MHSHTYMYLVGLTLYTDCMHVHRTLPCRSSITNAVSCLQLHSNMLFCTKLLLIIKPVFTNAHIL